MFNDALDGSVPPANGVIVSAVAFPGEASIEMTVFTVEVETKDCPTISEVPVARPTTVYGSRMPLREIPSWPGSVTGTTNEIS